MARSTRGSLHCGLATAPAVTARRTAMRPGRMVLGRQPAHLAGLRLSRPPDPADSGPRMAVGRGSLRPGLSRQSLMVTGGQNCQLRATTNADKRDHNPTRSTATRAGNWDAHRAFGFWPSDDPAPPRAGPGAVRERDRGG